MFHLKRITKNLKFWNNWGQYNQFKVLLSNKDISKNEYLILEHLDTFKNFENDHLTSGRDISQFIGCDADMTCMAINGLIEKGYIKKNKVNHHYYHFELLIINNLKSDEAKCNASKYINTINDASVNPVHCASVNPVHCASVNHGHIVEGIEENIEEGTTLLFFGKDAAKNKKELLEKYDCDENKLIAVMEYYHNLWPKKKSLYKLFRKCIPLGEFEKYYTRLRESAHQANRDKEESIPVDIEGIQQMVSEQDNEGLIINPESIYVDPEHAEINKKALEEMMHRLKKQMIINEVELTD